MWIGLSASHQIPGWGSRSSWPARVRKIHDDRGGRASHDNPPKCMHFRWIDLHVRQKGGNVNEIAGLRVSDEFTVGAPANLAGATEHECDRLLGSMMVNAGARAGLDFEYAAPDRGVDAELRRDRGASLRTRRLRGAEVELIGSDDLDCADTAHGRHHYAATTARSGGAMNSGPTGSLTVSRRIRSISAMLALSIVQPTTSEIGDS